MNPCLAPTANQVLNPMVILFAWCQASIDGQPLGAAKLLLDSMLQQLSPFVQATLTAVVIDPDKPGFKRVCVWSFHGAFSVSLSVLGSYREEIDSRSSILIWIAVHDIGRKRW